MIIPLLCEIYFIPLGMSNKKTVKKMQTILEKTRQHFDFQDFKLYMKLKDLASDASDASEKFGSIGNKAAADRNERIFEALYKIADAHRELDAIRKEIELEKEQEAKQEPQAINYADFKRLHSFRPGVRVAYLYNKKSGQYRYGSIDTFYDAMGNETVDQLKAERARIVWEDGGVRTKINLKFLTVAK